MANVLLYVLPLGNDDLVAVVGVSTLRSLTLSTITGFHLLVLPHVTRIDSLPRSDL